MPGSILPCAVIFGRNNKAVRDFMLKGLREVEKHLEQMNIPFYLLEDYPEKAIPDFLKLLFLDNCLKLQEDERQKRGRDQYKPSLQRDER